MTQQPSPFTNIAAEQAVLGALMLDNEAVDRLGRLRPEHFHDPVHRRIFETIRARRQDGKLSSPVTLKTALAGDAGLAELGGPAYLATLASAVVSLHDVGDYAAEIIDQHARRAVQEASEAAIEGLRSGDTAGGLPAVLEALEVRIDEIRGEALQQRAAVTLGEAIEGAVKRMVDARETGPGIPTGIAALDREIGGLYPGDLTIVAGRPGMGKSALVNTILLRMAHRQRAVVMGSLEMQDEDTAARALSDELRAANRRITYSAMRRGHVSDDEARAVIETGIKLQRLPVWIIGSHVRRLSHILSETRRIIRRQRTRGLEVGAFILDHIGLVQVPEAVSEYQRISMITAALKGFARSQDVPVIALSQLNRKVEQRDDKRPQLADLRDSGSVEQDADNVLFCYREQYYLERATPGSDAKSEDIAAWNIRMDDARDRAEVIIAKQRNGPVSRVRLGCDIACNFFFDLADGQEEIAF